jgi:hypothetical protein
MNRVCFCVKIWVWGFLVSEDKNIWGQGQVCKGRRISGQTTEPSQDARDRNPAFCLFRFRRISWASSLSYSLQAPRKTLEGRGQERGERQEATKNKLRGL